MNQSKIKRTRALSLTAASVVALGLSLAAPTVAHAAGDDITISTGPTTNITTPLSALVTATDNTLPATLANTDLGLGLSGQDTTVQTSSGGIYVTEPVTWPNPTTLTLDSAGDLVVDALISANLGGIVLQSAGTATVSANLNTATGLTVAGSGNSYISGIYGGSGDLTIQTSGTVTLSSASTYSGATNILSGTLVLASTGLVNSTSEFFLAAGAVYDVSATVAAATPNLSGEAGSTIILGDSDLGVVSSTSTTFAGDIIGTGSLVINSGSLTLTGNNTITHTGVGSDLTLGSPFTVPTNGSITVSGSLTNNSLLTFNGTWWNYGTVTNPGLIVLSTGVSQLQGDAPLNAVTIDANGGTGTFIAAEPGTTIDLSKLATFSKEPTWAGRTLLGWSTVPSGGTVIPVDGTAAFTPGGILYAQWGLVPTITTTPPPAGQVGATYSHTLTATGTAPITWSLASGALPPGLKLAANGVISGTPTATGSYTFTVMASNASGDTTASFTITIAAASAPPPSPSPPPPSPSPPPPPSGTPGGPPSLWLTPLTGDAITVQGWSTTLLTSLLGLALTVAWGLRLRRHHTW